MEEYNKAAWQRIVREVQETGVDGFELNLSCPHGLPERKMGMAMGEKPRYRRGSLRLGEGSLADSRCGRR